MLRELALLLALLVAIPGIAAGQDDDVIRVDSSLVLINATITDVESRPVLGLKKERFSVFEDGVEQKIDFFSAEETPFAAVILLDSSGSMESRISMARSAAISFLSGLRTGDMASIYRFDSKIKRVQDFSDLRDVDESIFEISTGGMTALNDSIVLAAELLAARKERRKAIIVLSDGEDTYSRSSTDKALKAALASGATIYTVDMSGADDAKRIQNVAALKTYAEKTGGRFISTPGGAAMRTAFAQIVAELGSQYTIAYSPSNTKRDGKWRSIELQVSRRNLIIRTRKGYNAPNETKARR